MGSSRVMKAIAAIAGSVTLLGVNVVLLDDYANQGDMPQAVQMAPITSPIIENISSPENTAPEQRPQYQQAAAAGGQGAVAAVQGIN
ncbi:MAG: hypothetical protein JXA24_04395 [Proteobacteria bacterium]|nr:hypothetical protein [Pseudomonadota bacterium]